MPMQQTHQQPGHLATQVTAVLQGRSVCRFQSCTPPALKVKAQCASAAVDPQHHGPAACCVHSMHTHNSQEDSQLCTEAYTLTYGYQGHFSPKVQQGPNRDDQLQVGGPDALSFEDKQRTSGNFTNVRFQ